MVINLNTLIGDINIFINDDLLFIKTVKTDKEKKSVYRSTPSEASTVILL